jgi:hypothetical protein
MYVYFSDRLYSDDEKPAAFKFQATQPMQKAEPVGKPAEEKVVESMRPSSPVTIIEP